MTMRNQRQQPIIRPVRGEPSVEPVHLHPASVKTKRGGKWGYIDDKGRMVLSPRWEDAGDFQANGLAVVQEKGKSGVIHRSGTYVVPPRYGSISTFSEGRAAAIDDQGFRVIDEQGRVLTPKAYNYIGMYQEGRALFSATNAQGKDVYGYLDRKGKEIIPARYETGTDFQGGKAVVQLKPGEFALIGRFGEVFYTYRYPYVGPWGDGLLAFQQEMNGPYGYIDEQGRVAIPPRFASVQPFEAGRAVVNTAADVVENQYGLIDKRGNYLIKPAYNDIQLLGEQRAAVGVAKDKQRPYIGSVYAIADTDGHFLTPFRFQDVTPFTRGLASANDGQHTFFIDTGGRVVTSLPIVVGSGTVSLQGKLVKAFVDQRVSYYNRAGTLVWKQNTIIPLNQTYRAREEKYRPNPDYLVYYPQIEGMRDRAAEARLNRRLKELSQVKPVPGNVQLDYSYTGDFEVAFFRKRLVVLELIGYHYPFGAAHGMPSQIYVNADLEDGTIYRLQDLFLPGSPYVQVLSDIVANQIKTNPEYSYVFPGAYKGIKPDQPFYVREDALYLYFLPYEIAPYVAGFPTFRVPFAQIMTIINRNGRFWRSFH